MKKEGRPLCVRLPSLSQSTGVATRSLLFATSIRTAEQQYLKAVKRMVKNRLVATDIEIGVTSLREGVN